MYETYWDNLLTGGMIHMLHWCRNGIFCANCSNSCIVDIFLNSPLEFSFRLFEYLNIFFEYASTLICQVLCNLSVFLVR